MTGRRDLFRTLVRPGLMLTCVSVVAVGAVVFQGFLVGLTVFLVGMVLALVPVWRADRIKGGVLSALALTLGPLAGPVFLIAASGILGSRTFASTEQDAKVPEPSLAERLAADIRANRRPARRRGDQQGLEAIFTSGDLKTQQAALRAILRYYAPDLRQALFQAMASEYPAIRVQAAAVYSNLRDTFAARAKAVETGTSPLTGAELQAEVAAIAASGFVSLPADDPADRGPQGATRIELVRA